MLTMLTMINSLSVILLCYVVHRSHFETNKRITALDNKLKNEMNLKEKILWDAVETTFNKLEDEIKKMRNTK